MAPKKAHKAESDAAASPAAQKREAARAAKEAEDAALEASRLETIQADKLVIRHSDATPALKVSDVFDKVMKRKEFAQREPNRGSAKFDWSIFRGELAKRNASSPTWFVQIRTEDLILEPNGMDGEHVEVAIVVEAASPTLAPMHVIYREARPYSDLEDNTPERIATFEENNLQWREVRSDAGEPINVFLLQIAQPRVAPVAGLNFGAASGAPAPAAAPAGFGAAAPAGFGAAPAAVPAAAPAGFGAAAPPAGFGASAAPKPAFGFPPVAAAAVPPPAGFGAGFGKAAPIAFGNNPLAAAAAEKLREASAKVAAPSAAPPAPVVPAAAAPVAFGFGAAGLTEVVTPKAGPQPGLSFAASFGAAKPGAAAAKKLTDVGLVVFTLWTEQRLKEMKKEILAGSRIVVENVELPAPVSRKVRLQMQNDMHDKISATVDQIVRKEFAKLNADVTKVDKWIDDCPIYDPKFFEAVEKMRERQIQEAIASGDEPSYDAVDNAIRPLIEAKLSALVEDRKKMLAAEAAVVDDIMQLVKKRVLLTKDCYRVLKYYPANDLLRFRPFGKVSGIHEVGETSDICVPPAYMVQNKFAKSA